MKSVSMKNLVFGPFMFLQLTNFWTTSVYAKGGSMDGGGGDPCENRIQVIRDDIKNWINNGGHKGLKLPSEINYKNYKTKMLESINNTKIKCDFKEVKIGNTEKTCRYEVNNNKGQIICNMKRFLDLTILSEADQYVTIHHELAGISGFEQPNLDVSQYKISNQISDYLEEVTIKKLAISKNKSKNNSLNSYTEFPEFLMDGMIETYSFEFQGNTIKYTFGLPYKRIIFPNLTAEEMKVDKNECEYLKCKDLKAYNSFKRKMEISLRLLGENFKDLKYFFINQSTKEVLDVVDNRVRNNDVEGEARETAEIKYVNIEINNNYPREAKLLYSELKECADCNVFNFPIGALTLNQKNISKVEIVKIENYIDLIKDELVKKYSKYLDPIYDVSSKGRPAKSNDFTLVHEFKNENTKDPLSSPLAFKDLSKLNEFIFWIDYGDNNTSPYMVTAKIKFNLNKKLNLIQATIVSLEVKLDDAKNSKK